MESGDGRLRLRHWIELTYSCTEHTIEWYSRAIWVYGVIAFAIVRLAFPLALKLIGQWVDADWHSIITECIRIIYVSTLYINICFHRILRILIVIWIYFAGIKHSYIGGSGLLKSFSDIVLWVEFANLQRIHGKRLIDTSERQHNLYIFSAMTNYYFILEYSFYFNTNHSNDKLEQFKFYVDFSVSIY